MLSSVILDFLNDVLSIPWYVSVYYMYIHIDLFKKEKTE